MSESKEQQRLNIAPEDYDRVIAEVARSNKPEITGATNRLFRDEVLVTLFGERFQGWFQGFRQIFTILFVPLLFALVLVWLLFVGYFLWRAAFYPDGFGLTEKVLIALITSTTATVIGLFHYANRWLFEIRSEDPSNRADSK